MTVAIVRTNHTKADPKPQAGELQIAAKTRRHHGHKPAGRRTSGARQAKTAFKKPLPSGNII